MKYVPQEDSSDDTSDPSSGSPPSSYIVPPFQSLHTPSPRAPFRNVKPPLMRNSDEMTFGGLFTSVPVRELPYVRDFYRRIFAPKPEPDLSSYGDPILSSNNNSSVFPPSPEVRHYRSSSMLEPMEPMYISEKQPRGPCLSAKMHGPSRSSKSPHCRRESNFRHSPVVSPMFGMNEYRFTPSILVLATGVLYRY